MALTFTTEFSPPLKLGTSDLGIHWSTGAPDGNTSPWSDLAAGSLYVRTDATADQSPWYVKVDSAGANDDWVNVFIDLDEAAKTLEAILTMSADTKIQFRDTGVFIHSNADGYLHIQADTGITLGDGTNQVSIQPDGEIQLAGTAKVTKTLSFPIAVGGGTADVEAFNGAPSINLDTDLETFLCALRMPGGWDAASDVTVFLDVANEIAEDDGDDLSFDFQMRGYADGETMSDAGYAPSTATLNLTGGDQAINVINRITALYDYDDGTYPLAANDTLVIEATVNLGGAGEVTGPLHVIAWGIQYTANKLGTAT